MENEGFRVTYLPVQNNGIINLNVSTPTIVRSLAAFMNFCDTYLQELEAALTRDTAIVSIMTVNNEIGVRQPVEEIGMTSPS
jgi:cysteine desulfurase